MIWGQTDVIWSSETLVFRTNRHGCGFEFSAFVFATNLSSEDHGVRLEIGIGGTSADTVLVDQSLRFWATTKTSTPRHASALATLEGACITAEIIVLSCSEMNSIETLDQLEKKIGQTGGLTW